MKKISNVDKWVPICNVGGIRKKFLGKTVGKDTGAILAKGANPNSNDEFFAIIIRNKIAGFIDLFDDKEEDCVWVAHVESFLHKKYKGIGSKLMQVAVETSINDHHGGKVLLSAQRQHLIQNNPINFYDKIGFKRTNPQQTEFNKSIYGTNLELSGGALCKWIEKIRQNPLLKF